MLGRLNSLVDSNPVSEENQSMEGQFKTVVESYLAHEENQSMEEFFKMVSGTCFLGMEYSLENLSFSPLNKYYRLVLLECMNAHHQLLSLPLQ